MVAHQRLSQATHQLPIHLTALATEGGSGVEHKGILTGQHLSRRQWWQQQQERNAHAVSKFS